MRRMLLALLVVLAASDYAGAAAPCDLIACAEAYSVTRAMTKNYTGPLFQLYNGSTTLDVGTINGVVNMSTWAAFCSNVPSNCVYSKIYAQVHVGSNDLVPSVFSPNSCNSGGSYVCAGPFSIDRLTGLPLIALIAPEQYTIASDASAVGINAAGAAETIGYNGISVTSLFCCGVFGTTHKYNASDTEGTDFSIVIAYGQDGVDGANCSTTTTFCLGIDEEGTGPSGDYGSSAINLLGIVTFDGSNTVTGQINNHSIFSTTPGTTLNQGNHIHLGGGGDLSQPDPVLMREAFIANSALSPGQQAQILQNNQIFYGCLSFPYLLNRDLDPASNDNSPAFLDQAA